ncbi:galactosyltransferase-related protein [Chitinophaga silvisoli]|uniref:Galactosyltransferase C-terminal domain-containing protein n=1 Tax=Chitinophaga silvisoli TaxID=2291814 RepID=A0A3E1NWY2_9BACT|nr:galactosyltransferase-related protein [Chitinophaga silvisoli]RFM32425.1 hypothetical protein DXN04_22325 [Chitinophaga silvisoli]
MIFMCAQPDSVYLRWQLEVLLFNLKRLSVAREDIHILIGYDPTRGLNPLYTRPSDPLFDSACFYFYEDTRTNKTYEPTIRPHIIKKHFLKHPDLNNQCIFYHDADIIFREIPDFSAMTNDDCWYVSDTLTYTSADAIKKAGKIVLEEMCFVLKIPVHLVEQNSIHSGGAQYLMKGLTYEYWDKIEYDSLKLYLHLKKNKDRYVQLFAEQTLKSKDDYDSVIEWCSDMWAVLWNAFDAGFKVKVSKELDFCWPKDELKKWHEVKIFHNAGLDKHESWEYFFKGDYINTFPFNVSLDNVRKDKCTYMYVKEIENYKESKKIDLRDVTFLIPVRIDSGDRLLNVITTTSYLFKHFKTNIILTEADKEQKIDLKKLPPNVEYTFIYDTNRWFHRTKYNNYMVEKVKTPIIVLHDVDVIINPDQLLQAANAIRNGEAKISLPFDGCFKMCRSKTQIDLFRKQLDVKILETEESFIAREKACGGCVMIDKATFIECGKENESFYKWGPEDIERVRRMEIMGYKAKWIDDGHLYHLQHEVFENSEYTSDEEYAELMKIQLNIIGMTKQELKEHILLWK